MSGGNKKSSFSLVLVPRSYILFQNISDTHFLLCERWKEHVILDAGPKQIQLWSRSIESRQQAFRVLNLNDWEDGNPLLAPFHPSWHCNLIGYWKASPRVRDFCNDNPPILSGCCCIQSKEIAHWQGDWSQTAMHSMVIARRASKHQPLYIRHTYLGKFLSKTRRQENKQYAGHNGGIIYIRDNANSIALIN